MVVSTVPFLYQTSSRPFNEEVDFFDFHAKLGYQVPGTVYVIQVPGTSQKNEERREPALTEGMASMMTAPMTMVLEVQQVALEV